MNRRGQYNDRHVENVLDLRDFELVLVPERVDPFINFCVWQQYLQRRTDGHYAFIHLLLRDTMAYSFSLQSLHGKELYTKLTEPSPAVALGTIKDRRGFDVLCDLALDQDNPTLWRTCAMMGLSRIGDARAIETLIRVLDDHYASFGESTIESQQHNIHAEYLDHLENMGIDALSIGHTINLMTELTKSVMPVAPFAVQMLGELRDGRAVEPLIRSLADPDSLVRFHAAISLRKLGNEIAVEPLICALNDPKSFVRFQAVGSLGSFGNPLVVEPLIHALADPDETVSDYAAMKLGKFSDSRAVEALIGVLADPAAYGRASAARSLGQLGDLRAVEPLIQVLTDPEARVVEDAAEALKQIGTPEALAAVADWRARGGE